MAGLAERFGVFGSTDGAEKLVGLFTDPWRFGRRSPNGSIDTDHPSLSTVLEAVDGIRLRDLVRSVRVIENCAVVGPSEMAGRGPLIDEQPQVCALGKPVPADAHSGSTKKYGAKAAMADAGLRPLRLITRSRRIDTYWRLLTLT